MGAVNFRGLKLPFFEAKLWHSIHQSTRLDEIYPMSYRRATFERCLKIDFFESDGSGQEWRHRQNLTPPACSASADCYNDTLFEEQSSKAQALYCFFTFSERPKSEGLRTGRLARFSTLSPGALYTIRKRNWFSTSVPSFTWIRPLVSEIELLWKNVTHFVTKKCYMMFWGVCLAFQNETLASCIPFESLGNSL